MRKIIATLLALLLVLTFAAGCAKEQTEPAPHESESETETVTESESETEIEPAEAYADVYKHVIVIGVDGAGTYFKDAEMPRLNEILADSAVTYSMLTSNPTISAQCWGSMLCGVIPEVHHFTNNIISENPNPVDSGIPSLFRVLRQQMPDAVLASFCNWNPINTGIIEDGLDVYKDTNSSDDLLSQTIADYVKENKPNMVFVQFDKVDSAGHSGGFGGAIQMKVLGKTDAYIGRIYDAYVEAGIIDDTLFIVTADHGGNEKNHGGWTDTEKYVMFAAHGSSVVKGEQIEDMEVRDVAAVVLHAFGLDAYEPEIWTGRVPTGLFEGVTAGERKADTFAPVNTARNHETEVTPEIGSGSSVVDVLGADRLLGYFPFDEGCTDALGKLETEESGKLYYPEAYFGSGIQFDDGYVKTIGFDPALNSYSIAFWMKNPGPSSDPAILGNKGWTSGANPGFVLVSKSDELIFNVGSREDRMDISYVLPADYTDGWTYVTVVVDRENAQIGFSADFSELTYTAIPEAFVEYSFSNMKETNIGQDGTGHYNATVPGTFDEMVFVDGVLTNDDIASLKECYGY